MMKPVGLLLLLCAMITGASCHKKNNIPAPTPVHNTDAPANVTNAIDSVAAAAHYKIDEYPGILADLGEYEGLKETSMSIFVTHLDATTLAVKSSLLVQISDMVRYQSGTETLINDTIHFTGPGTYSLNKRIACTLGNGDPGDSIHISWRYENNNHPSDPEHYCSFNTSIK